MSNYIMISTTCSTKKEALELGNFLLEERLVSCIQISEIMSSYYWKKKIVTDSEFLLEMKSKKELYSEIESVIIKKHSYELPQIIYHNIEGFPKYLRWIDEETK